MNSDDATAPPQNKITELPFFSAPIPDADLAGGGRSSVSEITLPDTDPFRPLRLHELPPASTNGHLGTAR
ncbi:type II/IV secretion system protein, partial [Rhodococcus sp. NPDC057014]